VVSDPEAGIRRKVIATNHPHFPAVNNDIHHPGSGHGQSSFRCIILLSPEIYKLCVPRLMRHRQQPDQQFTTHRCLPYIGKDLEVVCAGDIYDDVFLP
jgi:hypothetical protein